MYTYICKHACSLSHQETNNFMHSPAAVVMNLAHTFWSNLMWNKNIDTN